MSKPKISIIVPVYNASQYIVASLDSIIFQTEDDIETIIVDDRGSDDSIDKAKRYLEDYNGSKSFIFMEMPENGGPGAARNLALSAASGEYVAFLDSDDVLEPSFCEKLYDAAHRRKADIACCDLVMETMEEGGSKVIKNPRVSGGEFSVKKHRKFLSRYVSYFWTYVYRRQFLLENDIKFPPTRSAEDSCFLSCALLKASRIATVRKPLYRYRVRRGSTSQVRDGGRFRHKIASFDALLEFARKHGLYDLYREELDFIYLKKAYLVSAFTYIGNSDDPQTYVLEEMYLNFKSKFPEYRKNRHYRLSPKTRAAMTLVRNFPRLAIRVVRKRIRKGMMM